MHKENCTQCVPQAEDDGLPFEFLLVNILWSDQHQQLMNEQGTSQHHQKGTQDEKNIVVIYQETFLHLTLSCLHSLY
jgi:hypothetical protein